MVQYKFDDMAHLLWLFSGAENLSIQAYKVYMFSVLAFVSQLDDPPDEWEAIERRACARLFRGPSCFYYRPNQNREVRGLPKGTDRMPMRTLHQHL